MQLVVALTDYSAGPYQLVSIHEDIMNSQKPRYVENYHAARSMLQGSKARLPSKYLDGDSKSDSAMSSPRDYVMVWKPQREKDSGVFRTFSGHPLNAF